MIEYVVAKYNYWVYVVLIMIGFYAMMAKNNLLKKLIGMNIFQWSIILFYVSVSAKKGASFPVVDPSLHPAIRALDYVNPLPHVLMLTAIVVGVATTGIALSLLILVYRKYGTLEEDEILEGLRK